jgi:hypothetical protein
MANELIVHRRLPTYQFIIRTSRSVRENSDLLEKYLANQPRPRGFVISDPRLEGNVLGSTFFVREYGSWMWGSMVPSIEGEFVPGERGSDVVVEVGHSRAALWSMGAFVVFSAASMVATDGVHFETIPLLGFFVLVATVVVLVPVVFQGSYAARLLAGIFAPAAIPG